MGNSFALNATNVQANWFGWACLMGAMFIVLYNIVGITTQRISAAVSAVAYKVSLVIPVIFGMCLYNEKLFTLQWLGIALAVMAVILTCWPSSRSRKMTTPLWLSILLPAILFLGSGVQDAFIKYIEFSYLNDANKDAFLSSAFAAAAIIGTLALAVRLYKQQQIFDWRNVLAGICIGVPNYFSIWCLIRYLQVSRLPSGAIIPINNLGIVLCSALVAWLIFKENLNGKNAAGIFLSLIAIFLIAFGSLS
jgi:drug/metabolite transporter (DMT)-like permease